MSPPSLNAGSGTQLRHVLELLDGDVATFYADAGLGYFRPKFTPVVGALATRGPLPIRDLARAVSVTHSAASQTVAQMARHGLVTLLTGADARQRIVHLTDKARALLPTLEAEWSATMAAAAELDAELPCPLGEVLAATIRALERRPFRQRMADSAGALANPTA